MGAQQKKHVHADVSPVILVAAGALGVGALSWSLRGSRRSHASVTETDRKRLHSLIRQGILLHPTKGSRASLRDLSEAVAHCRGLHGKHSGGDQDAKVNQLVKDIGGPGRRHIVFIVCDGMGTVNMNEHLPADSFLRRMNLHDRLVSTFPATTPTALMTIATAAWPQDHGVPGWDLREFAGQCEFPGEAGKGHVQIRILHSKVMDMRTNKPVMTDFDYKPSDIFLAPPVYANTPSPELARKSTFISAYEGTDFTKFTQGALGEECLAETGWTSADAVKLMETVMDTLGQPKGSADAVAFFAEGLQKAVKVVKDAEEAGERSYTYIYTAHPDKHMHALGVEHKEIRNILEGFNQQVEKAWDMLSSLDVALIVTADHGHVSVQPSDMALLPDSMLNCLEYANIGCHGKGRHGCFHCKDGRQQDFVELWSQQPELIEHFLLLTIEDAAAEGLFGVGKLSAAVRPRLGDFIAISINDRTLITPKEKQAHGHHCQGAHGSMTAKEMSIPFILCTPNQV